jgi:sugar lactone lactonase YvrE
LLTIVIREENSVEKILRVFLILSVSFASSLSVAVAGEAADINVADRALNSTPLVGPEGIVLTPDGSAYVSERDGRIRRVKVDGTVEAFADLNSFPGEREERFGAIGLAMDKNGDIYAATLTALDGAVLKVIGPGKPEAGKVSMYRNGVNSANFVLIDDESGTMYVSDSSMFSGGVYRFDMNDESLVGTAADQEKELLGKYSYANGLALGPEKKWLYVAETLRGRVSRIDLVTKKSEVFVDIGGWTDGLLLDPEGKRLFVCDNKGGRIVAVDFSGAIVGDARLLGKEGQTAPACMLFRDANTIVYTDLWKASWWGALSGNPERHSYIYDVSVDEILK